MTSKYATAAAALAVALLVPTAGYSKYRKSASFALFGTNTVNGEVHTLWCVGNLEFATAKDGRTIVAADLTCPVS